MPKYRIIRGLHVDNCPSHDCPCPSAVETRKLEALRAIEEKRKAEKVIGRNHVYRKGEVFSTSSDLSPMNGAGGRYAKFELVTPDTPTTYESSRVASTGQSIPAKGEPYPAARGDGLDSLTDAELRGVAVENGVDTNKVKRREDIIAAIRRAIAEPSKQPATAAAS